MKRLKFTSIFQIVYIGVILALLITFFTDKDIYIYDVEGLSITETSSVEKPLIPKRIKSLDIEFKGLNFLISNIHPVIIESEDKVTRKTHVLGVKTESNRAEITLENNLVLNITVENSGDRLTISSKIPKVFPTITEISIPFKLKKSYTLEEEDLSYAFKSDTESFNLKINDLYYINPEESRIHLISQDDKIQTLTFSPLSSSDLPIIEQWYRTYDAKSEEDTLTLSDQEQNYLNKIEKGINTIFNPITFNQNSNSWTNIPRADSYTENSLIIYLAQGMRNKTYPTRLNRIKELKRIRPQSFTYASTPFLGNIIVNGQRGIQQYNTQLSSIKSYIRAGDSRFLSTWISEYYFEGEEIDLNLLESNLNNIDTESLSLENLGVILNNLLHILVSGTQSSSINDKVRLITDLIIERIDWDDTGLYLIENDNLSYMNLNLKIGELLLEASQYDTSKYSKAIGESLKETYFNISDSKGAVPESYNINTREFSQETILPEDSFIQLSNNPYLPHYFISQGIKIWTISDSITLSKTSREIRIAISYPFDNSVTENSHFLTIDGVEPYTEMYFRNRPWRADSSFEKWGVGYYYDANSKLLYFMPNHTKTREEITITY